MRKTGFVLITAAGLAVAACSGKEAKMSDELKKDLDMASTSDGLALAAPASKGQQVVSAIEQANPPAPKKVAPSRRVAKHTPAPKARPAPVEATQADVSNEIVTQPVAVAPAPAEPAPVESPRPRPVDVSSGNGTSVGRGGGPSIGSILGGIGIGIILGRGVDGDECDPRTDGRRGRIPVSINDRLPPVIRGTFPGSGRIGRR